MPRLATAAAGAVALSAVANTALQLGAVRWFGISERFEPLSGWAAAQSSAIGAIGAAVVLALLGRFTTRPILWFWRVSIGVLVLSFGPVVGLVLMDEPGGGVAAYGTLLAMHAIAFVCTVPVLSRFSRQPVNR